MNVTMRELNSNSSAVVRRARAGERVVITDRGEPVAEVIPYKVTIGPPTREELTRVFGRIGVGYDYAALRADLDDVVDPWL